MGKRDTFGSKLGTIMVVGGSVIGLGNIWRFPYVAGENGGAAFILIYLAVSFLISVPLMLTEFSIGRSTQSNALGAFKKLSTIKFWQSPGYLGIATAFTILAFYSVIAGWAMDFVRQSLTGEFMHSDTAQIKTNFDTFIASGWKPILWTSSFVVLTATIVAFGVQRGIERFNKTVMPLMLLILVILCVNSFSLDGFREGASFLLKPDFSKVGFSTVLQALGQSFFSLSLGMGTMITYGSYIKKKENMFSVAGTVAISDMTVAILSGLAIFPAVFSFGISPTSGPELVFLTLPNIFAQMPGGQLLAVLFFLLLFAAAITSSVSLFEVVIAYITEEFKIKRIYASLIAGTGALGLASLCAVSQMPGSSLRLGSRNLFDFFDYLSSNFMLPIGGLLIVIFAGWFMDKEKLRMEMTNNGIYGAGLYGIILPMIKFVIPIIIAMLFLNLIGLIK